MRAQVKASLTCEFAAPCEVPLLVEAAHGRDRQVTSDALTFLPPAPARHIDDPSTGERRTVFAASGRINALYRAVIETAAADHDLAVTQEMALADLPSEVLPCLRASRYSSRID